MKKLLLTSVLAIASFPGYSHADYAWWEHWLGLDGRAYAADKVPSLQKCRQMLEDQAPETPEEIACVKQYGEDAIYKSKPSVSHGGDQNQTCTDEQGKQFACVIGQYSTEMSRADKLAQAVKKCKEIVAKDRRHASYDTCNSEFAFLEDERPQPPARVTVAPPYQGPPPIGWVYGPYTQCGNPPQCSMGVVSVDASGLNVRIVPNGPPVMSLVNGTPLIPLQKQGD